MAENDQVAAIARSHAEWASLRRRLETITPATLARAGLTVGAGLVVLAVAAGTWPALMPFLVGAVIAYSVLPLVNRLDAILPRGLAALVSVLAVVGVLVAIVAIVLPPLVASVGQLATSLPGREDVDRALADAESWLGGQPLGNDVLAPALTSIVLRIRETMQSASGGLDDAAVGVAAGLASALGAALGLIILPTWMLTVISDQRRGQAVLNRRLAPWLRADFWAVVRIADRIASTYIRGFLLVGVVVGVLTYLGVRLSEQAGGPVFQEPLALAVFAGATQLVPEIGPFIGFLPALLLLPVAPERAAVYLARLPGLALARRRNGGRSAPRAPPWRPPRPVDPVDRDPDPARLDLAVHRRARRLDGGQHRALPPRAAVRAAAARRRAAMGSRSADRRSERARPGGGGCACAGCLSIDDVCEVT